MRSAKIITDNFSRALEDQLISHREFAKKIGTTKDWLFKLKSTNLKYKCSPSFCRRVLDGLDNKFEFNDLFYWVDSHE